VAFTFFFRDQQVLERAVEHVVPILAGRSHPRIWDAGVAMGQEPYTLAVVVTHGHSDHCALLPLVRAAFHPRVLADSPNIDGVVGLLSDGDKITMGDADFEIIHTPGHCSDSICLYNETEGVLFAGDSPLLITSPTGTHEAGFLAALEKLVLRPHKKRR
jgi:glyoxylase-like metal-dependent hydrolase (beta-lactamase superfamily II)